MKPEAIVYTSNTGFTARYAHMLGAQTGLPVYELGREKLPKDLPILYLGWLMAGSVRYLRRARRKHAVAAVCAVGLCGTGMLLEETRKRAKLPAEIPLFTVQGGMDHSKLKGVYKRMIETLIKMLAKKKQPSEEEQAMLEMIRQGGDFVKEDNLSAVLKWWESLC